MNVVLKEDPQNNRLVGELRFVYTGTGNLLTGVETLEGLRFPCDLAMFIIFSFDYFIRGHFLSTQKSSIQRMKSFRNAIILTTDLAQTC